MRISDLCSPIFRFRSFRISAGDLSSRYPLGWCGSSIRWIPRHTLRSFRVRSRPQQETDRWIGQNSLRRSFIGLLPDGLSEMGSTGMLGWRLSGIQLGSEIAEAQPKGLHGHVLMPSESQLMLARRASYGYAKLRSSIRLFFLATSCSE